MRRRSLLGWGWLPLLVRGAAEETVRGRLEPPAVVTADGRRVTLEGDLDSMKVVRDPRVAKEDFEAAGEFLAPDRFRILPIHLRGLFVWRAGKRLEVSYWCDICSIRTYSPGQCVCCQEETQFDPR